MFDVLALNKNARFIELARRLETLRAAGRDQRIECARPMTRIILAIRMSLVVEQLVLMTHRAGAVVATKHFWARRILPFLDEINNAAVSAGRDAPLESEIEVNEFLRGENFTAAGFRPAGAFGIFEAAICDDPIFSKGCSRAIIAPAGQRAAVKEQFPSILFFCRRKGIRRRVLRVDHANKAEGQQSDCFHGRMPAWFKSDTKNTPPARTAGEAGERGNTLTAYQGDFAGAIDLDFMSAQNGLDLFLRGRAKIGYEFCVATDG